MRVTRGVTRTVLVGRRFVFKLPGGLGFSFHRRPWDMIRGWLANRSEWRQRDRPDVAAPVFTLFHIVLVMPRAARVADDWDEDAGRLPYCSAPVEQLEDLTNRDEMKPSSWGWFPGAGWLLIDFDRAWMQDGRGLVGRIYYGRQERLERRWAKL